MLYGTSQNFQYLHCHIRYSQKRGVIILKNYIDIKKLNKEHCKNRKLKTKIKCWYFRNRVEIKCILLSSLSALLTSILTQTILVMVELFAQEY